MAGAEDGFSTNENFYE